MRTLTLKQQIFLAVEMRDRFLQNVEAEQRENRMGQRYAAFLLDRIIKSHEEDLAIPEVAFDLGYAAAIVIERRSASPAELGELIEAASAFDMKVSGSVKLRSEKPDLTATAKRN